MNFLRKAALAGLPWLLFGAIQAAAICAPPTLGVKGADMFPAVVRVGERVELRGTGWVSGCDDTGGSTMWGCSEREEDPSHPYEDIAITMAGPFTTDQLKEIQTHKLARSASRYVSLGEADAGERGVLTLAFEVPKVKPGVYIVTSDGLGTEFPIRVRRAL